jgi:hypothetical protein
MLLLTLFACDTGPNYGPFGTMIRAHRKTLETRPCDAKVVRELAIGLRDALAYEESLQTFRDYEAACEPHESSVLMEHLELAKDQKQTDEAVGVALALTVIEPENSVFRDGYIDLLLEAGRAEQAVPLLQTAYWANHKETDKLKQLAQAQEDAGMTCDALVSWAQLWWVSYDERGGAAVAVERLDPSCPGVQLKEEGTVKQDPESGYWRFDVGFGETESLLGLDTSAPLTYISTEVFQKLEGATPGPTGVTMKAGTGILVGDVYTVETVRVGTVSVNNVQVLVVPRVSGGIDGFIGLNIGSRMRMREKTEKLWTLTPPG